MTEKAVYFDSSKCTACKGCQVACKMWNNLPSPLGTNEAKWSGTHQNPVDLNGDTRLIITFNELEGDSKIKPVKWAFGRRACSIAPTPRVLRCAPAARSCATRRPVSWRSTRTSASAASTATAPARSMSRATSPTGFSTRPSSTSARVAPTAWPCDHVGSAASWFLDIMGTITIKTAFIRENVFSTQFA